ncbi:hypothetical protein RP20_CCG009219 [Aedes albopictus]|nr:hypothetical protein RP20_CCG009219 [Aedes albopictus]
MTNKYDALKPYGSDSDDSGDEGTDFDVDKLEPLEVGPGEHKLQYTYCLWFAKKGSHRAAEYGKSLHFVGRCASVEQWWTLYCHLVKPTVLKSFRKLHLFKPSSSLNSEHIYQQFNLNGLVSHLAGNHSESCIRAASPSCRRRCRRHRRHPATITRHHRPGNLPPSGLVDCNLNSRRSTVLRFAARFDILVLPHLRRTSGIIAECISSHAISHNLHLSHRWTVDDYVRGDDDDLSLRYAFLHPADLRNSLLSVSMVDEW